MKKYILLLLTVAITGTSYAQDPEFSQFYANQLYLNPAFAGTAQGARFALNYRNQWPSISSSAFVTYAASYDQHFDGIGGGIGFQVWHDQAGDGRLSTTVFSGIYSYHLNVSDQFAIKAGLQGSVYQRSIDFTKLRFGDMIHPKLGFVLPTQENLLPDPMAPGIAYDDAFVDFSTGILGFNDKFYAGVAVHHITEPAMSFYESAGVNAKLPRKYTGHLGMLIPLNQSTLRRNAKQADFIAPNIMYQRQGNFSQLNFGAYVIKGAFVAGLWYRQTPPNSDALIALVGLKKDVLKVGYSYDLTVSEARSAFKGSHEISLILEFEAKKKDVRKWRDLKCPTQTF